VIDHSEHGLPVAFNIGHDNRPAVQAQLCPGQDFKKFVQRARPAWQQYHCIAVDKHQFFAAVHIVCDNETI